jgi:hypothetical protein
LPCNVGMINVKSPRHRGELGLIYSLVNIYFVFGQISSLNRVLPQRYTFSRKSLNEALASKVIHRRNSAVNFCDSDVCCQSSFYCELTQFTCMPCIRCGQDDHDAQNDCDQRCQTSNQIQGPSFPALMWLTMTPSAVDASRSRQFVQIRFAVQYIPGLSWAQVTLLQCPPLK